MATSSIGHRDVNWADLHELPGLTISTLHRIGGTWSDGGLWDDVIFLANRFWDANTNDVRLICWHHLVLAVGNFKRQPGRRLRPVPLNIQNKQADVLRAAEIQVPGLDSQSLNAEDLESWRALRHNLPGAGVPTITTVLAALWPDQHVILDRRVFPPRATTSACQRASSRSGCAARAATCWACSPSSPTPTLTRSAPTWPASSTPGAPVDQATAPANRPVVLRCPPGTCSPAWTAISTSFPTTCGSTTANPAQRRSSQP